MRAAWNGCAMSVRQIKDQIGGSDNRLIRDGAQLDGKTGGNEGCNDDAATAFDGNGQSNVAVRGSRSPKCWDGTILQAP